MFFVASLFGQTTSHREARTGRYSVVVRLPLSQNADGIDGYVELLDDSRLTPNIRKQAWQTGEFEGEIDADSGPDLQPFKNEPPSNALIQIVGLDRRVIETKTLDPLAKLQAARLYGSSKLTYLLTVDYSAGFGSYSGPITDLVEMNGGHMRWVEATDARTGHSGEISLMSSLKTTWKLVDAPHEKGREILVAACRPDWKAKLNENQNFTG